MQYEQMFDSSYGADPPSQAGFEDDLARSLGVRNASDGVFVELTVRALAGDHWQGSGIHSPSQWLMWKAGVSRSTARRVVTLAVRAGDLPFTLSLLRQGRLSLDQAHAVARYTPAEYEESVANLAQCATVSQIVTATRKYNFDVERPDGPGPRKGRSMTFGHDDDGSWWARIRLAAEEGALVEAALGKVRDALHDSARQLAKKAAEADGRSTNGTDEELGVGRATWADSIVGMANSVLEHGTTSASARVKRSVHFHLETPIASDDSTDPESQGVAWMSELHGGHRLPNWLTRKLTCDCEIHLVWERKGVPISTSASFRNPPERLRRLIEHRDRYQCRVPGCDARHWLEVHHIIHWEDGGATITSNTVLLCGKHHRMHHQGLIGITGNADIAAGPDAEAAGGLVFTNEHGNPITSGTRVIVADPSDFPVVDPYRHPTGERLHRRWLHFNRSDVGDGSDSPPSADRQLADRQPADRQPAPRSWSPN